MISGVTDTSGLRLHMTPTLREHDVGLFIVENLVAPVMMIPPHFDSLTIRARCVPPCVEAVSGGVQGSGNNHDGAGAGAGDGAR